MTVLRTVLVLWLAILWLPASSHVLLEHAGVIHTHQPHDHPPAEAGAADDPAGHPNESHDAADGRCMPAFLDGQPLLIVPDLMPAVLAGILGLGLPSPDPGVRVTAPETRGTAPPELAPAWRFLLRTTLPVRAPSLVA